jgi:hypothetical protein
VRLGFCALSFGRTELRCSFRCGFTEHMNLDEGQRKIVAGWVAEGLKLSEIQKRLASELGQTLTYMEVRLLVDDLKLVPKDAEPARPPAAIQAPAPGAAASGSAALMPEPEPEQDTPVAGGISVKVDQIAVPGAVVSGKVTFSDGVTAGWQFDEMGRLRLLSSKAGYRPSPSDVQQFQAALDRELRRMGM